MNRGNAATAIEPRRAERRAAAGRLQAEQAADSCGRADRTACVAAPSVRQR
jgi:hypothetical protein